MVHLNTEDFPTTQSQLRSEGNYRWIIIALGFAIFRFAARNLPIFVEAKE